MLLHYVLRGRNVGESAREGRIEESVCGRTLALRVVGAAAASEAVNDSMVPACCGIVQNCYVINGAIDCAGFEANNVRHSFSFSGFCLDEIGGTRLRVAKRLKTAGGSLIRSIEIFN